MQLTWTNQLSVGNAILDADHRYLVSLVSDVTDAIRAGDGSILAQGFRLLENCLGVHFESEEKIALAIKFPFSQHKLAQQYSLRELEYMRDELVGREGVWSEDTVEHFFQSLKKWMIDEHIIKRDMLMKPVLQTLDYNFWPGLGNEAGQRRHG